MTVPLELISVADTPTAQRRTAVWQADDGSGGIETNLDPWLTSMGRGSDAAITLARIGVGAFIADRATTRNKLRQRREIHLVVRVPDPDLASQATDSVLQLLEFVTGDDWQITFEHDTTERSTAKSSAIGQSDQVALLSGGLDSFCGALLNDPSAQLFLSHSDAPVTKHSQNLATAEIPGFIPNRHFQVRLKASDPFDKEPSRRSRSILFVALAVALADAKDIATVEIPENGFTSLNPPLAANRGGVLTTRSTHPTSFEYAKQVLNDLQLRVRLTNPYEWDTKGELLKRARDEHGDHVISRGLATTLSCAKVNLVLPNSGSGRNCGLDYACLVRRGAAIAAGIQDTSNYACHEPHLADSIAELRRADIQAVKSALLETPTIIQLLSRCGPFPDNYNYQRALDLWTRGKDELASIPLP